MSISNLGRRNAHTHTHTQLSKMILKKEHETVVVTGMHELISENYKEQTPWPLVHSELYRLSDRHWSANFNVNFCG
jgi:hypothetical protein